MREITLKKVGLVTFISLFYLCLSTLLIGFKTDQLFLVALFNILYYASSSTRKFVLGFSVFIVFWVLFDSMKAFPNYNFNAIHTEDLYLREKAYFGINEGNKTLTPNEYADKHASLFLDLLTGFFYLNWMPVPLLFAFYLFRKNKSLFLQFSLTFLLVNLIGFVVYYLYPAAPPWYIKEYGIDPIMNTPGHTGRLTHFDDFFGIHLFSSLYSKSSNVFAAMPSLHSAYPVVVFYYGLKKRVGWVSILLFIFMTGIWFSAVYTGHHYVQDVIGGIACAVLGTALFQKVLLNRNWFRKFLFKYEETIA